MSEAKKESPLFGCLFLFAIAFLIWAFTADWSAPDDAKAADADVAAEPTLVETVEQAPIPTEEKAAPTPKSPRPKKVSLADLDPAERAIRLAINTSGYLCAKPIEVREAGTQFYGVRCITNRDGTGLSDYFVNTRTNEVQPF